MSKTQVFAAQTNSASEHRGPWPAFCRYAAPMPIAISQKKRLLLMSINNYREVRKIPDLMIQSDPYAYSTNGINYSGLMAASKILDDIRRKNSSLADELSKRHVTAAYLQQILIKMSPPVPKISFRLPPKEPAATGCIPALDEIIAINFYKRQTQEISGSFTIYNGGEPISFDIGMITLRALEAVFCTTGRTFFEMEAIQYVQIQFLRNISAIRYKRELIEFLRGLPKENKTVNSIVDRLIDLCETA